MSHCPISKKPVPKHIAMAWGLAVIVVAVINILDVLPDWATFAAILTLPFFTVRRCGASRRDARP
ncbi:hypothetical protein [uncultured Croceicoccus sp.]|uniref:hypothetical protein n=1 Tax=uncultured Croceicoccus sp. TaxID=1295329 RepID=UPI00261B4D96|nr:hypothetical protein [uncultured Croceicoccus sp.]